LLAFIAFYFSYHRIDDIGTLLDPDLVVLRRVRGARGAALETRQP
jgi:hypothetical protein